MKRVRPILALAVVVIAALVLLGVGQGSPGPQLPVAAASQKTAAGRLAKLGSDGTQGREAFTANGCNACHTIAVSGFSGRLGPNLDGYLAGLPRSAIRGFIIDPLSVNIPGYTHDLMPNNFSSRLSAHSLTAIVAYLHAVAG
jgi:mono/diheme cytochrome c family protein